jgi:hypothetical protein
MLDLLGGHANAVDPAVAASPGDVRLDEAGLP